MKTNTMKWKRPALYAVLGGVAALILIALVAASFRNAVASHTEGKEVITVAATKITRASVSRQLVFESEFRPFQEVDLHAKVAGYVQSINVDIGDHVKEGDLIATLELPEVQADLDQAVASQHRAVEEIHRAEIAFEDAKLGFDRLQAVDKAKPNLIAQQDLDTADARDKTAGANLAAAREQANASGADVKKLQTMLQYARIVAPFDGVITERYADKGALIQAGTSSSTQAMPLVRLSDNRKLRLVFPVSVSFVAAICPGKLVRVEIPGLHKEIEAGITRTAQKVLTSTRTMNAEIDLKNDDYSLIPGMYATVRMDMDTRTNALVIPVEALARGRNATVYVIGPEGVIEERKVKLGIESPEHVEALEGIKEGDLVMMGSRTQVRPGQKVIAKLMEPESGTSAL